MQTQHISMISQAFSWIVLKLLGVTLIIIAAGIACATFKYFVPDVAPPLLPAPYSPAAIAASAMPPIDYHQHKPPAGLTDNVPLPAPAYAPPLPRVPPHNPAAHKPLHPRAPQ